MTKTKTRRSFARTRTFLLALALAWPWAGGADPLPGEVLVMQLVSVSGELVSVNDPRTGSSTLELASDLDGRYRIDGSGAGAALRKHVGENVSVIAFVDLGDRAGRPLLRVERFTLHESRARASN